MTVDLDPGTILSMDMSNILGFNNSLVTTAREADSVVDVAQVCYALYVYTNDVESHVVVRLLRIVPLKSKHGDVVSKNFDNVQYITVLHRKFTTIEIDIRDDAGRHVPFERGRVTVTLHFRRRKPSLF